MSDSETRESKDPIYSRKDNDASWYTRYPELVAGAGSFPYPYRPGSKLNVGGASSTIVGSIDREYAIPGVLSLSWAPSVGIAKDATDPVNVTAREIYARVRKAYSGTLRADAPDYIVYIMCLDSIYSYIAWLKRLVRLLNTYSPDNYVVPTRLLNALGIQTNMIATLASQRTDLWTLINTLSHMVSKFYLPNSFDICNRHVWMNDRVFTDAKSTNSQLYIFNQRFFYTYANVKLSDGSDNYGPGAVLNRLYSNSIDSFDALQNLGINMINALVSWDESYTISGYLRRAFEGEKPFETALMGIDDLQEFTYSEEVLTQIENSRVIPGGEMLLQVGAVNYDTQRMIAQNPLTNCITCDNSYTIPNYLTSTQYLNTFYGAGYTIDPVFSLRYKPSPELNVIASRLHATVRMIAKAGTPAGSGTFEIDCGTEIPLAWHILGADPITNEASISAALYQTPVIVADVTPTAADISNLIGTITRISELEVFDWHPFVILTFAQNNNDENETLTWQKRVRIAGDVNNITSVSPEILAMLHRVCLYSEFDAFSIIG